MQKTIVLAIIAVIMISFTGTGQLGSATVEEQEYWSPAIAGEVICSLNHGGACFSPPSSKWPLSVQVHDASGNDVSFTVCQATPIITIDSPIPIPVNVRDRPVTCDMWKPQVHFCGTYANIAGEQWEMGSRMLVVIHALGIYEGDLCGVGPSSGRIIMEYL